MDPDPNILNKDLIQTIESGTLSPPPTPESEQSHTLHPRRTGNFTAHSHSALHSTSSRTGGGHDPSSSGDIRDVSPGPSGKRQTPLYRILSRKPPSQRHSHKEKKRERKRREAEDEEAELRTTKEKLKKSRCNPAVVLENSGSVARDHLASERTFLAYVRTSLALASMGVALVQLFSIGDLTSRATGTSLSPTTRTISRFAKPLGALTIALALVVLLQGLWRFFKIQVSLPIGQFPVARMSAAFTGFALGAVVVTIFGAILSGRTH